MYVTTPKPRQPVAVHSTISRETVLVNVWIDDYGRIRLGIDAPGTMVIYIPPEAPPESIHPTTEPAG